MNAQEVNTALAERALDVCRLLLPNGRQVGREWHVADFDGQPGKSLKVVLEGPKAGLWSDFAAGESGRMLDLWMKVRGIEFKRALGDAKEWIGCPRTTPTSPMPGWTRAGSEKKSTTAKDLAAVKLTYERKLPPEGAVAKYLSIERGIPLAILARYGVGATTDERAVMFPYLAPDAEPEKGKGVEMIKFLGLERENGEKKVWTSKAPVKALFGKAGTPASAKKLVICEGEIDAMTLATALAMKFGGLDTVAIWPVSVPFGAKATTPDGRNPNDEWIANDFDYLEQFEEIILCFDADAAGQAATAGLFDRLGRDRCSIVQLPEGGKDPNDILQARPGEGWKILAEAVLRAKGIDPEQLKNAEEYRENVWNLMNPPDGKEPGLPFVWTLPFRLRAQEVTLWTGFSGHGKTQALGNVCVHTAGQGERVCIASMEMRAEKTLENLLRQAAGRKRFEPGFRDSFDDAYDWMRDHFWIYDHVGNVGWQDLIRVFRYAWRRYNVRHFVVDSLLKCNIGEDDYDSQKAFVAGLCDFAHVAKVHVHLVAHSKKKESEAMWPSKLDVKGSGSITDLVHNGITFWRNKAKEDKIAELVEDKNLPEAARVQEASADSMLVFWKQRETGEEPKKRLWFDSESWQFREAYAGEQGQIRRCFIPGGCAA